MCIPLLRRWMAREFACVRRLSARVRATSRLSPVARVGPQFAHPAAGLCRKDPDRPGTSAGKRRFRSTPTCCTCRPRARCSKIPCAEPEEFVFSGSHGSCTPMRRNMSRSSSGVATRRGRRRVPVAGGAADAAERDRWQAQDRPSRSGREPLSRAWCGSSSTRARPASSAGSRPSASTVSAPSPSRETRDAAALSG
jgi:hypothetical protein